MFSQFYRLPEILDVSQSSRVIISLSKDVSDYVLMQAIRAPLLELVVVNAGVKGEWLLRLQAGFNCSPYAETCVTGNRPDQASVLERTVGQGVRLYTCSSRAPARLIERLRRGLLISFAPANDNKLTIWLETDGDFELVKLETDLRLSQDPEVLQTAKSVLAREPEYGVHSASLAILITELEQARRELHEYLSGSDKHPGLTAEALRLEPMLAQRRQWLLRQYASSQERHPLGVSANDVGCDTEKLKRLLTCYELLSPPDVNAMVHAIAAEE
ncbi:hypothetical protein [Shewanella sp.]|uniref:hypothetical protein n=1 Tax=Shewanella sp. TaxID=50422 RepID=UPI003568BF5F